MEENTPLLEARRISRRHPDGQQWLLREVSVAIDPGTRLGVVGDSGSGKTLLLRALARLDPVEEGEVCFQGRPVAHAGIPEFRRQAIYLHQRAVPIDEQVEAALRRPFTLAIHRDRQFDRGRIVSLLEHIGRKASFLDQPAGELSGGEIQIVALLRAIQLDPAVLLLDEPTAALDPRTSTAAEELLDRWFAEAPGQRSMVWVTHDEQQARRVADRTIRVHQGTVDGEL